MTAGFFIHITDLHLDREKAWNALEEFVRQIGLMNPQPEFVVNGGDVIFGDMQLTMDPKQAEGDFRHYLEITSRLKAPLYNVLGNHDVVRSDGIPGTAEYTKEMYLSLVGRRYYSFDRLGIHFVALDTWIHTKEKNTPENAPFTMDGIDDEQIGWLRDDLAKCTPGEKVCFLSHHRVNGHTSVWDKVRPILRKDLQFVNLAGCDHRNTCWTDGEWQTFVTGSFCGAWWDGLCVDTSPPGYALITVSDQGETGHYYRPTEGNLAMASPRWSQVVFDDIEVDAIDPATGERSRYVIDSSDWPPGWNEAGIKVGGVTESVTVFRAATGNRTAAVSGQGCVEFEIMEMGSDDLRIEFNGLEIGRLGLDAGEGRRYEFAVPDGRLKRWNRLALRGDAVIRLPLLAVGKKKYRDPRDERFESVKPDWFGEHRILTWDISLKRPTTPILSPGSEFFFNVGES